jgi:hypothetical protein
MSRSPRGVLAPIVVAVLIAFGAADAASADTPNIGGMLQGAAQAAPVTPAYDAPRPAGVGTGRKIG